MAVPNDGTSVSGALIGRVRDIAMLHAALHDASSGRGHAILLAGEPGIGKTALADRIARDAEGRGFRVLWGSCWEGEGAPEYWPWVQVLRAYARDRSPSQLLVEMGSATTVIARIVPQIASRFVALPQDSEEADPEAARFRLFDGVAAMLKNASAAQPLLIVFDDLHWADSASVQLLRFLARDLRDASLLVLGTYRELELSPGDPASKTLAELTRDRLVLSGLGEDEVAALIADTTGTAPPRDVVAAVHGRTTGNPFLVKEIARLLAAQGRLAEPGAAIGLTIPDGVRDVVARRLARLSQACATVLEAASVLGPTFEVDVLAAISGSPADVVLASLDEAVAAGLLDAPSLHAGRFAFAHALVRAALHDGMASQRRIGLHLAAGEALERASAGSGDMPLAEIADHFIRAVPACEPSRAAEYASRAGARALGLYAYEDAARHFRRAQDMLALAGASAAERIHPLLNLADALTRSGDLPDARRAYVEVAGLARDTDDAEALAHAALGLGTGPGGSEVRMFDGRQMALLKEALQELPDGDSALRAWLLARLSVAQVFVRPPAERAEMSRSAVAMARRVADLTAYAYALGSLCDAMAGPDHIAERIEAANEIVRTAEEIRARGGARTCGIPSCTICLCDPEMALLGRRFLVVAYLERGDVADADAQIDVYARLADHVRQPLYRWYVPLWRANRALLAGDWAECERSVAEAERLGERAHSDNSALFTAAFRAAMARFRGRVNDVVDMWSRAAKQFPAFGGTPQASVGTLWLAIASGNRELASATLRHITSMIDRIPHDSQYLSTLLYIVEASWILDEGSAAEPLLHAMEPFADLFVVDGIGATVLSSVSHQLALVCALLGRKKESERYFNEALRAYEAAGAPILTARAQRDYAVALVRSGGAPEVIAALADEAARGYEQLGVDELAREARAGASGQQRERAPAPVPPSHGTFRHEGDFWAVGIGASVARIKDSKGLRDIATLLAQPRTEILSVDLYRSIGGRRGSATSGEGPTAPESDTGPVLDERARAEYKRTLVDLDEELREAEELGDTERASRARDSMDFIAAELAAALGLGGRARRTGDPVERARKAVTERIRDALRRIEKAEPTLGRHLRRSIRTGSFCSYDPDEAVRWTF